MTQVEFYERDDEEATARFRAGTCQPTSCGTMVHPEIQDGKPWLAVKLDDDSVSAWFSAHGKEAGVDVRCAWGSYLGSSIEVRLDVQLAGRPDCAFAVRFEEEVVPFLMEAQKRGEILLINERTYEVLGIMLPPDASPLVSALYVGRERDRQRLAEIARNN